MNLKSSSIIVAVVALLLSSAVAMAQGAAESGPPLQPAYTFVTTITVNSTTDPDTSDSRTCLTHTPCTLRRAVIQARNLPAGQKPALIAFNIPTGDPGYNASPGIWKIQFNGISSIAQASLRQLNGQIIIDGSTQPGGRATGPKIILVGEGTGQRDGIKVGETATHNGNQVLGLGFQNFKTHMYLNSSDNTVQGNWFGLNDAGTAPLLRNGNPQDGSGSAGIAFSAGVSGNDVSGNRFLGFDGVAIAVRGNGNTVAQNYIGMAADGTTPGKQTAASLICTPDDWLGGGGISVQDQNQTVEGNVIAGLRQQIFEISQQPDAIRVSGTGHTVRNNQIGKTVANAEVGVCGRGIFMSDGPRNTLITGNTIINSRLSGISLNGALYDANTLRSNVIKTTAAWPQVDGAPKAEDAIQLGSSLADPFELFVPARVTTINGTAVSGTSGSGSPCPSCTIELFLDDTDSIKEALQSLVVVQANADGNWSATIPAALTANQGIRTTSTSNQFNAIPGRSAGTTTGLSDLYRPQAPTPTPPPGPTPGSGGLYLPVAIR